MIRCSRDDTSARAVRWPVLLLASTMLTGLSAPAAFAAAASASSSATALEEIVVTAQKREENLQSVPVSIQALGEQRLDQLQVKDFGDYVKFLPSVSYKTAGPGFTNIYMRGVASGENANHSGPRPSVGVYLDEQPITTITGPLEVHVYDIARVEALAGPQGTLYGASSQSGTIRIITNKPTPRGFEAGYHLEVNQFDHGGTGYLAEGFVNQPISDHVAVRLVGWAEHDGGYIDNVPGTRTYPTSGITISNAAQAKNNYNDVDTVGARAALQIDLNENWTITPQLMGQTQETNGIFAFDPAVGDLEVVHFYPETSKDKWFDAALTVQGKIGNFDLTYAGAYLKRDVDTQQDYSDYSYFYDAAYGAYITDASGKLINPSQFIIGHDRYTKQSHELRLASPAENRLKFVAGLFYERQTHGIEQNYIIAGFDPALSVEGHPGNIWLTKQERTDIDYAVFGEATFDITDRLAVTGGIRFFKTDNSLKGFFGFGSGFSSSTGVAACFGPPVVSGSPCTNLNKNTKEDGNTWKLNATYKVSDDKLIYGTISTGFRPGGINRRGTLPPYQSDYLKNYEVGWKTTWADGSFRWNGAFYYDKWEDFQFSFLGANGLTEIRNAAQADSKGVETDINWRATEALTFSGSAAYTDAKLTKPYCPDLSTNPTCAGSDGAPTGTELPITPKFKANLTGRYVWDAGSFHAHVQGSVIYQSSSWADLRTIERNILGKLPEYAAVDLTAGVARSNWTLEAYLKNAFDERGEVTRYAECAIQVCGPQTYIVPIRPRLLGIRFGQTF